MNNTVRNVLIVVAILLALLLGWSSWSGMNKATEIENLQSQNSTLSTELSDMEALKISLEDDVTRLQSEYEGLTVVNDSLANSLLAEKSRVANRNRTISKLKADAEAEDLKVGSLSVQIGQLIAQKADLENQITSLQEENTELRERAGLLEEDLGKARDDNAALANLNRSMQGEIEGLTLANFKASAFQIVLEKKNSKATAKGRRARRMKASFDLTAVPEKYQGVRPIYLVITNELSSPIKLDNPIKAQVLVNDQNTDIIAAEMKEVNIEANQRISFTHDLSDKLKKGYYRVIAYTDIGILGTSNFRLQ
ncbi:MAG: cell division protein FtsB [Saprospiraceae bacterium]|jgi:cell division protein FtsB